MQSGFEIRIGGRYSTAGKYPIWRDTWPGPLIIRMVSAGVMRIARTLSIIGTSLFLLWSANSPTAGGRASGRYGIVCAHFSDSGVRDGR
jgi:hypothetical protein